MGKSKNTPPKNVTHSDWRANQKFFASKARKINTVTLEEHIVRRERLAVVKPVPNTTIEPTIIVLLEQMFLRGETPERTDGNVTIRSFMGNKCVLFVSTSEVSTGQLSENSIASICSMQSK